jgi:hypothetical protein
MVDIYWYIFCGAPTERHRVVRDIVGGVCQSRMYFFSLKNCTRRLCRTGASFVRFHPHLRETVDNTFRPPALSNLPETRDHPLYRELLERVHQDPTTQECDLEEGMTRQPNNERQVQEDVKQVQKLRAFKDYLHEHGLQEEEVGGFGNCLFLSIGRHVPTLEDIYSIATPEDPKSLYNETTSSIRDLTLDHILEHRSAFEGSYPRTRNTD